MPLAAASIRIQGRSNSPTPSLSAVARHEGERNVNVAIRARVGARTTAEQPKLTNVTVGRSHSRKPRVHSGCMSMTGV